MRSPSQRCRASSFDRVPPRLVAFSIVSTARSTRPAQVAVGDLERDEEREPRIPHDRHGRMRVEPLRQITRRRFLTREPGLERPEPAEHQPGRVRRGDDPGQTARQVQPVVKRRVARDGHTGHDVVVPGQHLRGRVEDDVAPELERPQPKRRSDRRVADDRCGIRSRRFEVGHREERVRRGLDEDQVDVGRRRSGLVELDDVDAPRLQVVEEHAVAVVRPLRQRDPAARVEHRQDDGRHGAHPGWVEERVTAVEPAELLLARDTGRMVGARVGEPSRLAVLVRPGGAAVEWVGHRTDSRGEPVSGRARSRLREVWIS